MPFVRPALAQAIQLAQQQGRVLLMDGAMGTLLMQRGWHPRYNQSHEWNDSHPDVVRAIHRDYEAAGAVCLSTNSFTAHLGPFSDPDQVEEAIRDRIRLAETLLFESTKPATYRLGCLGTLDPDDAPAYSRMMAAALSFEKVDALLLETQTDLDAVGTFMNRCKERIKIPFMASFVPNMLSNNHQAMAAMARWVQSQAGHLLALGVNCGPNPPLSVYTDQLVLYRQLTDLPLFVKPSIVQPLDKESWWQAMEAWFASGASLMGGCCGTTPTAIAWMAQHPRCHDSAKQG